VTVSTAASELCRIGLLLLHWQPQLQPQANTEGKGSVLAQRLLLFNEDSPPVRSGWEPHKSRALAAILV
jgi:hypothetical protein